MLAINGGRNIRTKSWPRRELYNKDAIKQKLSDLIDSDNLSGYRGNSTQAFWGGKHVRGLERWFEGYIGVKVLAVNSCTSALQIACGAIGLQPCDEVIVTPWSMTCSATAPMVYGAIPVFADIEKDYFCLDPKSVEEQITEKTKAIIVVDLFGQTYDVEKINAIAKKHNLYVIEDCAQALGASYKDQKTGTLGDIGCFSFTQGKHFTCGEGGFITINNEDLYMKCALIRNHAEAVINSMPYNEYYKMPNQHGFNMRMTEMQALVLLEQFKGYKQHEAYRYNIEDFEENNIDKEIKKRQQIIKKLTNNIKIKGITWGKVRKNCTHSYYVLPFLFDENQVGIDRHTFIEAVKAELRVEITSNGITNKIEPMIWEGYIKPIYKMPIFRKEGFHIYDSKKHENVGDLQNYKFCFTTFQSLPLTDEDIQDIIDAFMKVANNIEELK